MSAGFIKYFEKNRCIWSEFLCVDIESQRVQYVAEVEKQFQWVSIVVGPLKRSITEQYIRCHIHEDSATD